MLYYYLPDERYVMIRGDILIDDRGTCGDPEPSSALRSRGSMHLRSRGFNIKGSFIISAFRAIKCLPCDRLFVKIGPSDANLYAVQQLEVT